MTWILYRCVWIVCCWYHSWAKSKEKFSKCNLIFPKLPKLKRIPASKGFWSWSNAEALESLQDGLFFNWGNLGRIKLHQEHFLRRATEYFFEFSCTFHEVLMLKLWKILKIFQWSKVNGYLKIKSQNFKEFHWK